MKELAFKCEILERISFEVDVRRNLTFADVKVCCDYYIKLKTGCARETGAYFLYLLLLSESIKRVLFTN